MIRSVLFRLDQGIGALTADLEKHAKEGYLPQLATLIPVEDSAPVILFVLVQYAEEKPAEVIPTTEIPLGAKPQAEIPGNGGSHP